MSKSNLILIYPPFESVNDFLGKNKMLPYGLIVLSFFFLSLIHSKK